MDKSTGYPDWLKNVLQEWTGIVKKPTTVAWILRGLENRGKVENIVSDHC